MSAAVRRAWSSRYLAWAHRAGQLPRYGSDAWAALDDHDPRKLGSAIAAAEAWATWYDDIPADLAVEVAQARADQQYLVAVEHAAWKVWAHRAANPGPSFAELQRRRYGDPTTAVGLPLPDKEGGAA